MFIQICGHPWIHFSFHARSLAGAENFGFQLVSLHANSFIQNAEHGGCWFGPRMRLARCYMLKRASSTPLSAVVTVCLLAQTNCWLHPSVVRSFTPLPVVSKMLHADAWIQKSSFRKTQHCGCVHKLTKRCRNRTVSSMNKAWKVTIYYWSL